MYLTPMFNPPIKPEFKPTLKSFVLALCFGLLAVQDNKPTDASKDQWFDNK